MEVRRGFRHPVVGGDEEFPLGLSFDDQQPVQPNIVDVDAVRKVAARIVTAQLNAPVESVALYLHSGRDGFTGSNGEFQRLGERSGLNGAAGVAGNLHKQLRFFERLDVGEFADFTTDFFAANGRRGGNGHKIILRYRSIGIRVDRAEPPLLFRLDDDRCADMKPGGYATDV